MAESMLKPDKTMDNLMIGFSALEVSEAKERHLSLSKTIEKYKEQLAGDSDVSDASTVYKYRRSRRKKRRVNYMEVELPREDEMFWCDTCDQPFRKACPSHGPLLVIPNKKKPTETADCMETIPSEWIRVGPSNIPGAGLGVFAVQGLPARVQLGPYDGVLTARPDPTSDYVWQVEGDNNRKMYVDGKDPRTSSWLRYVNCARNVSEQNLQAFQHKGKIYYRTVGLIWPGAELLTYYGSHFAKKLGLPALNHYFNRTKTATNKNVTTTQCDVHPGLLGGCDEKPFKCDVCGRGFSEKGSLTRHMRTHTGEKPYKCDVCSERFTQKGNLTRHMRTHTGEKSYKCDVCSGRFTRKGNLTDHMRTHTGEKPYKCDVCSESFTQKGNLTRHLKTHTGGKLSE